MRIGPGQTGAIPNNEMATPRDTDHAKPFPPGAEISAELTAIEAGGRKLRMSRARAEKREERAQEKRRPQRAIGSRRAAAASGCLGVRRCTVRRGLLASCRCPAAGFEMAPTMRCP